jgi:hypothetical protein
MEEHPTWLNPPVGAENSPEIRPSSRIRTVPISMLAPTTKRMLPSFRAELLAFGVRQAFHVVQVSITTPLKTSVQQLGNELHGLK